MAAIKQLERRCPSICQRDAEWFQAWKASGIDQEVYLPRYFRQLDLPGGERKCLPRRGDDCRVLQEGSYSGGMRH